ncbi:hypothetical protein MHYP_G00107230 [Metynnis hypsauchen]
MRDSRDDSLNTSQTHPNTLTKKASTGLECFCCIQSRLSLDQRSGSQRFPEVMGTKPRRPSEFGPRQDVAMSVPVRSQRPVACLCQLGPGLAVPDLKQRSSVLSLSKLAEVQVAGTGPRVKYPVISHFSKSTAATITVATTAVRLDCSGSLTREGLLTWTSMCPNCLSDNSPVITCHPLRKQPGASFAAPPLSSVLTRGLLEWAEVMLKAPLKCCLVLLYSSVFCSSILLSVLLFSSRRVAFCSWRISSSHTYLGLQGRAEWVEERV